MWGCVLCAQEDEEEEEEEEMSLGQETLVTARPGHTSEFSAGQLAQYTEDTLVIHDEVCIVMVTMRCVSPWLP